MKKLNPKTEYLVRNMDMPFTKLSIGCPGAKHNLEANKKYTGVYMCIKQGCHNYGKAFSLMVTEVLLVENRQES